MVTTPNERVLKPWAWLPMTASCVPPPRASHVRPNRSTAKLYPISFQPWTSMWYAWMLRRIAGTSPAL